MKSSRYLLFSVAVCCIALLVTTLYFQMVGEVVACPLCVIQRYLFTAIALVSLFFACLPERFHKAGAGAGLCIVLAGIGIAVWHVWRQADLESFCDIDPLEHLVNAMPTANLLPWLFRADGICSMSSRWLGMSVPQWSLLGLSLIGYGLVRYITKPEPLVPWVAGQMK